MSVDMLKAYAGKDLVINRFITIRQPILDEIIDYGEEEYFGLVRLLCATPADLKVDIWDNLHIYWDQADEFQIFIRIFEGLKDKDLSILFKNCDLKAFRPFRNNSDGEVILRSDDGAVIDRAIFTIITDYLRKTHFLKKNCDVGFDEATKDILIEDERMDREAEARKPFESALLPLISSMVNSPGFKYRQDDVGTLHIMPFMDSVMRINKMKDSDNTMYGIYSGTIDIKKINKKELNWMGSLYS